MFIVLKKKYITIGITLLCCFALIFNFVPLGRTVKANSNGIELPIVMYHQIAHKNKNLGKYVILDTQFEKDLQYLKKQGYQTINMTQLIDYVQNGTPLPEKPIMITFDDGQESFYAYIYPLLEKYESYAVLSIVGAYADTYTELDDHHLSYSYLNWTQIEELTKSKWTEIQNHTYNMHDNKHGRLGCRIKKNESLADYTTALNNDIGKLQQELFKRTGWMPNTFTYPYGYYCKESVQILQQMGFEATLTCSEKLNYISRNHECLYGLGRFNRPNGLSSEAFFEKILRKKS